MNPLEQATIPPSEVDRVATEYTRAWDSGDEFIRKCFAEREHIRVFLDDMNRNELVFKNDVYQVNVRKRDFPDFGLMIHLSIKRIDRAPCHDWRDFQTIKNQLCGEECEAVEIYPAESRLCDTANQYHLWVIPEPGICFPFGFESERLVNEHSRAGSVNRPFDNHETQTAKQLPQVS